MAIATLINWYDERADWLKEAVTSVNLFSNQIIAVDGAYALFPDAKRESSLEQSEAIRDTARLLDMGCTIVTPPKLWADNEIEKRSTLFAVAEALTTENDWYFLLDSDEYVIGCPYTNLSLQLSHSTMNVANVNVWEKGAFYRPYPKLFRALRGIRVVGNHWTYELPDGRRLWGHGHRDKVLEPAADFTMMRVFHRSDRAKVREEQAQKYYKKRDATHVEYDP